MNKKEFHVLVNQELAEEEDVLVDEDQEDAPEI